MNSLQHRGSLGSCRSLGRQARVNRSDRHQLHVIARVQPHQYSGKNVSPPVQGKHFLHIDDFTKDELIDMLERAKDAKKRLYAREASFKPFKDMSMAMIFTKPSARTRVSFETVSNTSASCDELSLLAASSVVPFLLIFVER